MKEEIIGGLRNALEHGMTVEQAAQSFLNAGYNPQDVQDAVQSLGGVSAQTSPTPLATLSPSPQKINQTLPVSTPSSPSTPPVSVVPVQQPLQPKKSAWHYVLIGLSIVIVVLVAALIGVIAFSDQILKWLKP